MKTVKRLDGYYITGILECDDCGPYATKADAEDTRRGLQRTFDNMDDWSFWTSEPEPKKC